MSLRSPDYESPDVLQEVFNWRLCGTMPDWLCYEGEYLGRRVFMNHGGDWQLFGRRHGRSARYDKYKTANDLLNSFPRLGVSDDAES